MTTDAPDLWAVLYRERWGITPPPANPATEDDDDE